MNKEMLKDLEGKIVEVMILKHGRAGVTGHGGVRNNFSGHDIAYIGRLAGVDEDHILLSPGVYLGQVFNVGYYESGFIDALKERLQQSLTAVVSRECIAGIHQSIYTAEELSVKK